MSASCDFAAVFGPAPVPNGSTVFHSEPPAGCVFAGVAGGASPVPLREPPRPAVPNVKLLSGSRPGTEPWRDTVGVVVGVLAGEAQLPFSLAPLLA